MMKNNSFARLRAGLARLDFWLAAGLALVFARGLFLDVMDVDASQYASISMEMLQGGHWLQVMHRHADYLDKPPLLFWTSAASMAAFGLSNFAYKLPSMLAALAGIFATYRFARLFYEEKTARLAAFILASSLGLTLIANDVRTDTLLLGTTACAIWQLAEYQRTARWTSLLVAAVFVGLAMLAKGPIGLVVPAFAVGTHLLLRRDWRGIFRWQWLVALVVVALVLAPMCWGLYQQFDLHPEKPLRDRRTTSGLYFFFWEQSFGRVTGENVWRNDSSPLFFVHTYLWAFAPWAMLFLGALVARLRAIFAQKLRLPDGSEGYSLGAFLLTFAALSTSNYKLPHYIFVTLPWASVLTAQWLSGPFFASPSRARSFWKIAQRIELLLVMLLAFALPGYFFSENNALPLAALALFFGAGAWLFLKKTPAEAPSKNLAQASIWVAIGFGAALNFWFYPHLLPYQSTAQAGRFLRENGIPAERAASFEGHGHALDFYAGGITQHMDSLEKIRQMAAQQGALWLFTTENGRAEIEAASIRSAVLAEWPHFQVARLSGDFLNPATRQQATERRFLLKISGN